jgi:hypothetical protein
MSLALIEPVDHPFVLPLVVFLLGTRTFICTTPFAILDKGGILVV